MNGFICGGNAIYSNALRKEHCVEMKRLRAKLKQAATASERNELRRQMSHLTAAYQQKCQAIDRSLF